jgi:CubicO group peptidase (beta-lactamase class C family)
MAPGMQILVARKGKVIYQKSFGYQTYEKKTNVTNTDLYDVASLTKILSTLPNVMLQYDQQNIKMETTLGSMLPIFKNSNKQDIHLRNCCRIMPDYNLGSLL